jgi:hypothetical protein
MDAGLHTCVGDDKGGRLFQRQSQHRLAGRALQLPRILAAQTSRIQLLAHVTSCGAAGLGVSSDMRCCSLSR